MTCINSMPIPLLFSILLLVLHSNNNNIVAKELPTTTFVSKDDLTCTIMCNECDNPCKPVPSPPPPVVKCPPPPSSPPPSPPPEPKLPECPPPPAVFPPPPPTGPECPPPPPVPPCQGTCVFPPPSQDGVSGDDNHNSTDDGNWGGNITLPPIILGDCPPVSYYPVLPLPPPSGSFRLRIHEPAKVTTSIILFLAIICYL